MQFGKELKLKRLLGEENLFLPDYKNSISLIPDTVESIFGGKTKGLDLKLPESERVVLLFVDSVGFFEFKKFVEKEKPKVLENGFCSCISSVAPTTTSVCIPAVNTGLTVSESGFFLHRLFLEEKKRVFDFLNFRENFPEFKELSEGEKSELLGLFSFKPTIFERLEKLGVDCFSVVPKDIVDSGLRKITDGNVETISFEVLSDLVIKTRDAVKGKKKFFCSIYWPYSDTISHKFGRGKEVFLDLKLFFRAIEWLSKELGDCLFLIVSDHGNVNIEKIFYSNDDAELDSLLLVPPFGDSRLANFKAKEGRQKELFDCLSKKYGKDFLVLTSQRALDLKIYGLQNKHPERIGDLVLIARNPVGFLYDASGKRKKFLATHSGLTKQELLVPFAYFKK